MSYTAFCTHWDVIELRPGGMTWGVGEHVLVKTGFIEPGKGFIVGVCYLTTAYR